MDKDVEILKNTTTIKKIENSEGNVVYGDKYHLSRFQIDQGAPIDYKILETYWINKFTSFNDKWSRERQNYRFLHQSFLLFYYSFEQLRFHKVQSINSNKKTDKILYHNNLCSINLYGMYHHGKKCIDILKKLGKIEESGNEYKYCVNFSETRNKIIEHNYNPRKTGKSNCCMDIQIDPCIFSLISTDSLMEVRIHNNNLENTYIAYIDYYDDYYKLEKIISNIIKKF